MRLTFALLAIIALTLVGGFGSSFAGPGPQLGGRVVVSLWAGWDQLDPAATAATLAREIMGNIYDPLLIRDPATGDVKPSIATQWTVSPDGRVIVLRLRRGIKFHDGTPLTAESVEFSLKRIADPALRSPMAATVLGPVESFEVVDTYTVRIFLKAPFAPFIDSLTEISLAPVSPAAVRKYGKDFGQNPVGTGPFMVKEVIPNERVVMVRNPDYRWAGAIFKHPGPAYLDELVYEVVPEDLTRIAKLVRGEVQVLHTAPARDAQRLSRNPNFRAYYATQPGFPQSIVLQTSKWPFDDLRVRVAIAHAINKQELFRAVYEGVGDVVHLPLSSNTWGYAKPLEQSVYPYNPERARQILTDAGWRPGPDGILVKDGRPFRARILSLSIPQRVLDAQVKQAQLRAIGIDTQITSMEQSAWFAAIRKGEHDITQMAFVSADPDVLYTIGHSSQIERGWNTAYYKNPELDSLLDEARTTMDPARRKELYSRVQEHLIKNVPYIPHTSFSRIFLTSSKLQGYTLDARAFQIFHDVWISR